MRKYEYVPAAIESAPKGFFVGVRTDNKKHVDSYEVKVLKNGYSVRTGNRTVYFLRACQTYGDNVNYDFDVVHNEDYFLNPKLLTELGFKYAMVNSQAVPNIYKPKVWKSYRETNAPIFISDSGGFQISTGVSGFISPEDTVKSQSLVSDIGIALDVPFPITAKDQVPLFIRAAKTQKQNLSVQRACKSDHLELMNVIHGSNFYLLDTYRGIVEDSFSERMSIGGVRKLGVVPMCLRLLHVIREGRKYKHYHALGVSGVERWFALNYLAQKNVAELITSDSTTYLKNGINMQFFTPGRLCYCSDARTARPKLEANRRLACSCPACSTVATAAALADRVNRAGSNALVSHNLITSRAYLAEIHDIVRLPHREIGQVLKGVIPTVKIQNILRAMTVIDCALQDGVTKAAAKYCEYMVKKDPVKTITNNLFHIETPVKVAKISAILDVFDRYHESRK